jgi:hypothetical protein
MTKYYTEIPKDLVFDKKGFNLICLEEKKEIINSPKMSMAISNKGKSKIFGTIMHRIET